MVNNAQSDSNTKIKLISSNYESNITTHDDLNRTVYDEWKMTFYDDLKRAMSNKSMMTSYGRNLDVKDYEIVDFYDRNTTVSDFSWDLLFDILYK